MALKEMFKNVPESFKQLVKTKYRSEFVAAIKLVIDNDGKVIPGVVPAYTDVFNAFSCYDNVKVVLIGQDPYVGDNAHGYSFSSLKGIPPSIKNIYKCLLYHDLLTHTPKHADLSSWADQGVLLLNAALTCQEGKPKSHIKEWAPFTRKVVADLSATGVAFILLGKHAEKICENVPSKQKFIWGHPSPINLANLDDANPKNFKYATVFNDVNTYLESQKHDIIDWDSINN